MRISQAIHKHWDVFSKMESGFLVRLGPDAVLFRIFSVKEPGRHRRKRIFVTQHRPYTIYSPNMISEPLGTFEKYQIESVEIVRQRVDMGDVRGYRRIPLVVLNSVYVGDEGREVWT